MRRKHHVVPRNARFEVLVDHGRLPPYFTTTQRAVEAFQPRQRLDQHLGFRGGFRATRVERVPASS